MVDETREGLTRPRAYDDVGPVVAPCRRQVHDREPRARDLADVVHGQRRVRALHGVGADGEGHVDAIVDDQARAVIARELCISSDGRTITVKNRKLNTTDRYPLFGTPLHFILNDDVDLRNNNRIVDVRREDDNVIVDVETNAAAWRANVSIVFSGAALELRQWTVVDAQGLSTTVALRDVKR